MLTSSVTIIGGGFTGTMLAAQLAAREVDVIVIDAAPRPATGAAYATTDPGHILNVRASSMSALAGQPADFADFIAAAGVAPDGFAARRDYARYLAGIAERTAASGRVERIAGRARSARPDAAGWTVALDDGRKVHARQLVLASGNPPPAPLASMAGVAATDRVDTPWQPDAAARLRAVATRDAPVLIVGTGLTMVDAVLTLDASGHRGPITAVSRRGLVPHGHADGLKSRLDPVALETLPTTVRGLARWLRARAAADFDWRLAIDALRPVTHPLWRALRGEEQRRFVRHARAWWDIHRHRLAPQVAARIADLREAGQLTVIAGRLVGSRPARDGGYDFTLARRGGADVVVHAELLVNATGPAASLAHARDPLLVQLRDEGLVRPDEIDLGIALDADDHVVGHDNFWAIGPVARGNYWEMTAVPDLSVKVAGLAETIADALAFAPERAA